MTKAAFGQSLFLTGPPALAQGAAAVRGIVKKLEEWFPWLNIALARTYRAAAVATASRHDETDSLRDSVMTRLRHGTLRTQAAGNPALHNRRLACLLTSCGFFGGLRGEMTRHNDPRYKHAATHTPQQQEEGRASDPLHRGRVPSFPLLESGGSVIF